MPTLRSETAAAAAQNVILSHVVLPLDVFFTGVLCSKTFAGGFDGGAALARLEATAKVFRNTRIDDLPMAEAAARRLCRELKFPPKHALFNSWKSCLSIHSHPEGLPCVLRWSIELHHMLFSEDPASSLLCAPIEAAELSKFTESESPYFLGDWKTYENYMGAFAVVVEDGQPGASHKILYTDSSGKRVRLWNWRDSYRHFSKRSENNWGLQLDLMADRDSNDDDEGIDVEGNNRLVSNCQAVGVLTAMFSTCVKAMFPLLPVLEEGKPENYYGESAFSDGAALDDEAVRKEFMITGPLNPFHFSSLLIDANESDLGQQIVTSRDMFHPGLGWGRPGTLFNSNNALLSHYACIEIVGNYIHKRIVADGDDSGPFIEMHAEPLHDGSWPPRALPSDDGFHFICAAANLRARVFGLAPFTVNDARAALHRANK